MEIGSGVHVKSASVCHISLCLRFLFGLHGFSPSASVLFALALLCFWGVGCPGAGVISAFFFCIFCWPANSPKLEKNRAAVHADNNAGFPTRRGDNYSIFPWEGEALEACLGLGGGEGAGFLEKGWLGAGPGRNPQAFGLGFISMKGFSSFHKKRVLNGFKPPGPWPVAAGAFPTPLPIKIYIKICARACVYGKNGVLPLSALAC